jgi:flagellar biosynthesis/type III secretory pathway protein FliH
MTGAPRGIYESLPLQYTRLVVVSELSVARDTLLVRLLGAGSVLKQAIAELQALPAEAPERRLALPVLLRLRLTVPTDPAQQTSDDQEFLMNTQDIIETWRREAIQEGVEQGLEQGVKQGLEQGVKQGLEQGERKVLLRQLRRRFGAEVDGEIERRVATVAVEQIEVWAERVLSAATLTELLAG